MAFGGFGGSGFGGNKTRGTQIMTALESLKSTDYWQDRSPGGLEDWKELLQQAVINGLARQVTAYTYELGPVFWEAAEKAICPERSGGGGGGGGGVEGRRVMGPGGAGGGGGFRASGAEGGGGFGARGFEGGGSMAGMGDRGVRGGLKGPTQIMTALESLKTTEYWPDRSPGGLAEWKDLLQMAVRNGLARQVTAYTYELGPEFWEAAEKEIRSRGPSRF